MTNETPATIAATNYETALDQSTEYSSLTAALAAYRMNAVHTADERQVSAWKTEDEFDTLAARHGVESLPILPALGTDDRGAYHRPSLEARRDFERAVLIASDKYSEAHVSTDGRTVTTVAS